MNFNDVWNHVKGYKYSCEKHCRRMYDLILEEEYESCLELGLAYGKMTCVMAAAMDEVFGPGGGYEMHAVDLARLRPRWKDSVQKNLKELGLKASIWYEDISYTWRLMKLIAQNTHTQDTIGDVCEPVYDLIFIDGAHNVYEDAGAFFLADKLLKRGGMMVFDDLSWTHAGAMDGDVVWGRSVMDMSPEERGAAQVGMIWDYLVKQHPLYDVEYEDEWFAYARKANDNRDVAFARYWGCLETWNY